MVMSKKEYDLMEHYKNTAIRFEQTCNIFLEQIKDLKSYLRVAIKMAEMNDVFDKNKIIVYKELLQYMEKNMKDYI